jgi:fibronectin-binding autotransporter adhesin
MSLQQQSFASGDSPQFARRAKGTSAVRSRILPLSVAVAAALFGLMQNQTVGAATVTWDPGGMPGSPSGGPGTWDTGSSSDWSNGATDSTWVSGNSAVFGGASAGTVTLSGTDTAGAITFNTAGYTLGGGTALSLNGGATITAAANATINSVISGSAGLTSNGTATLTLGGNNLYTGTTTSTAGILTLNGTHSAGSLFSVQSGATVNIAGTETVSSGGQFVVGQDTGGTSTANVSGTLNLNSSTSSLIGQNANSPIGILHILNGGTVNVTNGAIIFGNANAGNAPVGILTMDAGATMTLDASGAFDLGNGPGNASGIVNLNGGVLTTSRAISDGNGDTANLFYFNGGTLTLGTNLPTIVSLTNGKLVVRNGGAVIDTNGSSGAISQSLLHSTVSGDAAIDGGLTKLNAGTLTLSGADFYNGLTTISAGTLKLTTATTNNIAGSKAIVVGSGATFDVSTGTGGVTGSGGFALASGQTLGGTGTVSGPLTVASGSTISAGASSILGTGTANAIGTLGTAGESWNSGGKYSWKISTAGSMSDANSITNSGGTPGTDWDDISMASLVASSTGSFTIAPVGALTGVTSGHYNWVLAQLPSATTITGAGGASVSQGNASLLGSLFTLDTRGLTVNGGADSVAPTAFSLELLSNGMSGSDLVLSYNAAPEPGAGMLVVSGVAPLLIRRRRRRNDRA